MSKPALVLVTTSFPIAADGSEAAGSFVSDLVQELARSVPVRVVAPGLSRKRERWSQDIEVFRYEAPGKPLSTLTFRRLVDLRVILRVLRSGARATREAVDSGPTSHVLALWALPSGGWARRATRGTNIRFSVWTLGSDIWTLGRIPVLSCYLSRVLRGAHACYSDGYKLADATQRLAKREVEFLPSTRRIELRPGRPPSDSPPYRLLFLGRWHPNKGVDILLDALDLLTDSDWSLIDCVEIQGGGPMDSTVRHRVADLRARGRPVQAGGFLAKREAESAIVRVDWVLIPSRVESIPLVFSDSMKLGRPVVSTPVGDLPRLLAEYSVGVSSGDITAGAFASAISNAVASSPRSRATAIAEAAKLFSLDNGVVPRILDMLRAIEDQRGAA